MDGEPIFLSRAEVDVLHADSLKLFGGITGVRDDSLVESAMGAAKNEWFYGHGGMFSVAAAYAFHLAQNQAILDGNKRTAAAAALAFLAMNGLSHNSTSDEQMSIYDALIAIAERRMTKPELAALFRELFAAQ